jgi:hypothetical protein
MSPHVVVISWGGFGFDSDKYESDPANPRFDPRVDIEEGDFRRTAILDDDPERPHDQWRPSIDSSSREALRSRDFLLPDHQWISYGIDEGPRPTRIPIDSEFNIEIDSEGYANKVERGDVLILLEGSKERELRDEMCFAWVDRQSTVPSLNARTTVADYKAAIWERRHDIEFRDSLIRAGLSQHFVHSQIARANPFQPAMGPKKEEHFRIIAEAARWRPPNEAWEHFRQLRSGYIHAGREIRARLKDVVKSDHRWLDKVDAQEIAVLEVPTLGTVIMVPVLSVVPGESLREYEDLGRLRKR